ncbi:MAG: PTS sugar transporter subunit IIA [Desulfatitalea sp.]
MELSIQQVAARLQMPEETILRWVRQGKIPMQHSRGDYFIRLEMLERWANEHQLKVRAGSPASRLPTPSELDGIVPAMRRGGILAAVPGATKENVLRSAVDRMANLGPDDADRVYAKLIEREYLASTGIGHGIALPHPRSDPGIALPLPQITTCFLERPIDFDAVDQHPVSVLMVLLSGSTRLHLQLLSKISFYLRDQAFRDYLLAAPPADALLERVAQMESNATLGVI